MYIYFITRVPSLTPSGTVTGDSITSFSVVLFPLTVPQGLAPGFFSYLILSPFQREEMLWGTSSSQYTPRIQCLKTKNNYFLLLFALSLLVES